MFKGNRVKFGEGVALSVNKIVFYLTLGRNILQIACQSVQLTVKHTTFSLQHPSFEMERGFEWPFD